MRLTAWHEYVLQKELGLHRYPSQTGSVDTMTYDVWDCSFQRSQDPHKNQKRWFQRQLDKLILGIAISSRKIFKQLGKAFTFLPVEYLSTSFGDVFGGKLGSDRAQYVDKIITHVGEVFSNSLTILANYKDALMSQKLSKGVKFATIFIVLF